MTKPNKHAELIKAWADGAEIEVKYPNAVSWTLVQYPKWTESLEYRVKPVRPKEIEKILYLYLDIQNNRLLDKVSLVKNIMMVFDGDTGELKSAEMIK
jgi:hypothetical protein